MEKSDELWVIFKLKGNLYAIKSDCIQGIFREPEKMTNVPDTESYIKGIIKERGNIVTLMDLRTYFGMHTVKEEYEEFDGIIEQAETAHKKWVAELCRCADSCCVFSMEKDPHHCAFGRWYDKYEAPLNTVQKRMERIRQPHYDLHHLGVEYDREISKEKPDEIRLKGITAQAKELQKKILTTMEEARETFKESYRTMAIELKLEEGNLAFVVDEIIGVEHIGTIFEDSTLDRMKCSELINGVASTSDGKNLLFLIDENQISSLLTSLYDQLDEEAAD